jgi:uncharacterized protein YceH (UPF0502 family)
MTEEMNLDARQLAVMCVLMLRGAQTAGEVRTRSGRLFDFASLDDVEATLESLMARLPLPPVARLPRRAGQKEVRYAHTLAGPVTFDGPDEPSAAAPPASDRIEALEKNVADLTRELSELRARVDRVLSQFE